MSEIYKVLITKALHLIPKSVPRILSEKCELIVCESVPPNRDEIIEKIRGVDAILWIPDIQLTADILDVAGRNVKAVSTMSSGFDHVDVPELQRRNIPLGHTPSVLNAAVADLAIGLVIAAARRFHEGRLKIENDDWITFDHTWMLGQDIQGSIVGFVGFGNIGQAIAKRLQGFEIGEILYYSRRKSQSEDKFNAKHVSFCELLKQSDFVIIICPLTDETQGIFNEEAFNLMKPNSVLINVARGGIVDQNALYCALKERKIFAAGLDVMKPEPLPKDDPILALPNCSEQILIPHLGSATEKTEESMAALAARNILLALDGKPMIAPAY